MRIIIIAEVNDTEDGIDAKTRVEVENHVNKDGGLIEEDTDTGLLAIRATQATKTLLKSLRKIHEEL